MLTREEWTRKWMLYAAAALACIALQRMFFQRVVIWGVIPFIYPLLAVIPATYEDPAAGGAFALGVGVVCDWLLPGGLPCFYTLLFPVAGLVASLFSKLVLPTGFLCTLAVSLWVFAAHGIFRCLTLWGGEPSIWTVGLWTAVREFIVTAPLCLPVMLLFHIVAKVTHEEE